jgi:hypothetical protein
MRPPDARESDAGGDRRWKGDDRIECEGGRGGCSARRAARAQGRFLVISAFRHDDGLSGRRASTRRDPGRVGDSLMADDATIDAGPSQSARRRIPIPVLD